MDKLGIFHANQSYMIHIKTNGKVGTMKLV